MSPVVYVTACYMKAPLHTCLLYTTAAATVEQQLC